MLSLTVSQLKLLPFRGRLRSTLRPLMAALVPKPLASLTSMSGVEDGVAKKFWIKFYRESVFSMYTPFAVSLAAGNLDVGAFRSYVDQDAWFLKAFAQAYSLAEECADDDEAKIAISELRKDVMEELKMHDSFAQNFGARNQIEEWVSTVSCLSLANICTSMPVKYGMPINKIEEWGSEITKESTPNSATVKYTDFLLATASGKVEGVKGPGNLATPFEKTKVAAYTLGAMTPCMRLYAFLGEEFQKLLYNDEHSHPYKKWIDNYSNESFQAAALKTEEVLDKLSVPLTGEELDVIENLYHQAMKLEIEFFLAQPLAQPTSVPLIKDSHLAESRLLFFSDFDLTCTVVDSSAILAEIAIVTAPKSDQSETQNQLLRMSSAELRKTWDLLSKQYTEEFEKCIESILPLEKVDEFNYENLVKAFKELSDFEKRANSRVIESGVLKGLNIDDIKRAGQKMILQDGCISFFQKLLKNENVDVNVHVLSYCWSGDLIRSALLSGDLQVLNIHTNELTFDESISTGEIVKKIESPVDKVQAFDDIFKACENDNKNVLTIYVGDSVGDLLCLLKADIGIVVGSSSSLRRVGSHFGISFVPLFSGVVEKQRDYREGRAWGWKCPSGTLYTVSSWAEIHAFMLGW